MTNLRNVYKEKDYPQNICKVVFKNVYKKETDLLFNEAEYKQHEKVFIKEYDFIIEKWDIFGFDAKYREVIELHYKEHLDNEECAKKINISITLFNSRMQESLKALMKIYKIFIINDIHSLDFLHMLNIHDEEKGTVYTDIHELEDIYVKNEAFNYFCDDLLKIKYTQNDLGKCFCRKSDGTITYTIYLLIKYIELRIDKNDIKRNKIDNRLYKVIENKYIKQAMPKELKDKLSSILGKFDFTYINNIENYEDVYEKEDLYKILSSKFILDNLDVDKLASLIKAYRSFE